MSDMMKITLVNEYEIQISLNDLLEKIKDGKFSHGGRNYIVNNIQLERMKGTIKIREVK